MDAIYSRRSIRKFKSDKISHEDITELLKAACAAPSAKNRQPWRYIVFEGRSKEEFCAVMEQGLNWAMNAPDIPEQGKKGLESAMRTLTIMRNAPVFIAVIDTNAKSPFKPLDPFGRVTEICDSLSIGAAVQNLILLATEKGIGSLWIANTFFAHEHLTAYLKTEEQLASVVALGLPDETPVMRPRKVFEELIEFRE